MFNLYEGLDMVPPVDFLHYPLEESPCKEINYSSNTLHKPIIIKCL